MKNLFFLWLLLLPFTVWGQKGFYEGYVVTLTNDTIRGMLKHKSGDEVKERVFVKISEEEKKSYKASELISYKAGDDVFLAVKLGADEHVFMRVLSDGYFELYEHQFALDQGGNTVLKYEPYIRKKGDSEFTAIKLGGWKKQVMELLSDYEDLVNQIDKNKYKLEDIQKIFQEYNLWKAKSSQ